MGNDELSKHKVAYVVAVSKTGNVHITKYNVAYINETYTYLITGKNKELCKKYTSRIKPSLSSDMKDLKNGGRSVRTCLNETYWDISDNPKITEKILMAELEYENDVRLAELAASRLIEAKAFLSEAEERFRQAKENLKKYEVGYIGQEDHCES